MKHIHHWFGTLRRPGRTTTLAIIAMAALITILTAGVINRWLLNTVASTYQDTLNDRTETFNHRIETFNDRIETFKETLKGRHKEFWRRQGYDMVRRLYDVLENGRDRPDEYKNELSDYLGNEQYVREQPYAVCLTIIPRSEFDPQIRVPWYPPRSTTPTWDCDKEGLTEDTPSWRTPYHKKRDIGVGFERMGSESAAVVKFQLHSPLPQHSTDLYMTILAPPPSQPYTPNEQGEPPIVGLFFEPIRPVTLPEPWLSWVPAGIIGIGVFLFLVLSVQYWRMTVAFRSALSHCIDLAQTIKQKLHIALSLFRRVPGIDKNEPTDAFRAELNEVIDHSAELAANARALGRVITTWDRRHEPVDVVPVVKQVMAEYGFTTERCKFRLENAIRQRVSRDDIETLFKNLFANVQEHGDDPVTVLLKRTVDTSSGQDEIEFVVSNGGSRYKGPRDGGQGLTDVTTLTRLYNGHFDIRVGEDGTGATASGRLEF